MSTRTAFITGAAALGTFALLPNTQARASGYTIKRGTSSCQLVNGSGQTVIGVGWSQNGVTAMAAGKTLSLPYPLIVGQVYNPGYGPQVEYQQSGLMTFAGGGYIQANQSAAIANFGPYPKTTLVAPLYNNVGQKQCNKPPCPQDDVECTAATNALATSLATLAWTAGLLPVPIIDTADLIAFVLACFAVLFDWIAAAFACNVNYSW